jgi:hypothetical protein
VDAIGGDAQSGTDLKDFADAGYDPATNKVQGVVLTDTVTTYTGNTPQTGDAYAIVNSGTHGNAAIKGFVDDIGVAGAGLTAIPWNAAWDAEVQSEVSDELTVRGATSARFAFLENINNVNLEDVPQFPDNFGSMLINASGHVSRVTLVDTTTTNTDMRGTDNAATAAALASLVTTVGAAGAGLTEAGGTGDQLTAVPWNASWDAEVQSEVTDALTAALTEGYRAAGATGSVAQLLYEIAAHLGRSAIASTTKTLKKIDGSTTAKTFTLDSATTPTAISETT